jgi:hypothetical protein
VLGLSDADAWGAVAVTPMIGVNDVSTETFTVDDAKRLADFASSKGLAWLSMWSGARDKQCTGGAKNSADPTCSSIVQQPPDCPRPWAPTSKRWREGRGPHRRGGAPVPGAVSPMPGWPSRAGALAGQDPPAAGRVG